jgi:AraC family transcriptional regulator
MGDGAMASQKIDLVMLDGLQSKTAFTVGGLARRFNLSNRNEIPLLWQKLVPSLPMAGQLGRETYGVEWGMSGNDFFYMAGVAVAPDTKLPEGFVHKALATQKYIVFRLTLDGTPFQSQMHTAAHHVWEEWAPKNRQKVADAPDFEFYPADFDPMRKGSRVEFWLPAAG